MEQISSALQKEIIDTLVEWIKVPSVEGEPAPGAPFGVEARKMLDIALEKAKSMGFSVRNFDGYAGDVRMGPEGVNPLAILGHLDVVPIGKNWTMEPFGEEVHDGKIYGRGTSDDKGPVVAALYAMDLVKKAGIPLKREVRLIMGCNEEGGMSCIQHYAQVCDLPKCGFSPDASYPLINTEKAGLDIALSAEYCNTGLVVKEIDVGQAKNVIPGAANAVVYGNEAEANAINAAAKECGMEVTATCKGDGTIDVFSQGIAGHAAYPENTRNALGQMLVVLAKAGMEGPLKTIAEKIGIESDGTALGIKCEDQVSGDLTLNMGILRYNRQDGLSATLDLRLPMMIDYQAIFKAIEYSFRDGVHVEEIGHHTAHHVPEDSKLIKKLLQAYEEVSGLKGECLSTGGGTYARCLEEGVAFGAIFPGEEELCHQADEYIPIDSLMKNVLIIAKAIELLQ